MVKAIDKTVIASDTKLPDSMSWNDECFNLYADTVEDRFGGKMGHVTSGFKDMDEKFGCWLHNGHLIIIAGRPAMGKSALAQQISEHVASQGKAAIFLTLEMSVHDLVERSISRHAGVSVQDLKRLNLTDDQLVRVSSSMNVLSQLPILNDGSSYELSTLVAKVKTAASGMESAGKPPLGLVVIDHLQIVSSNASSRNLELGQITSGLKRLAKELNVPVVAISQLNRAVEGRNDKRPTLADLRESGNIEQDADLVLFVYRDEYYDENSSSKGVCEITAGKNRHGSTSTVKLSFDGERLMFEDLKS